MQPLIDVEPAMSAGDDRGNGFQAPREEIVKDTVAKAARPLKRAPENPATRSSRTGSRPKPPPGRSGYRSPRAGIAGEG